MTTTTPTDYIVDAPSGTAATPDVVEVTLAADIGNARADLLVQAGADRPIAITMPALRSLDIVFARDLFDRRGLPPTGWRQLAPDEHVISRDGFDRYLGKLAVEHARASSGGRGSNDRYSDGTTAEFILAGLGAALPKATKFAVRCATLLPIKLWATHHQHVENSLRGRRDYTYNGRQLDAQFDYVAVIREGEAAYHALPTPPKGRAVIVDAGGRTINVALFADGRYHDGATIDNMGVETVFDSLDRMLEIGGLRPLRLDERIELQRRMVDGQAFSISHGGLWHRIDTKARQLFDRAASTIVQEIKRLVDLDSAEGGAFVGGGALPAFFGDVVTTTVPILAQISDPQSANVAGALALLTGQPVKAKGRKR
jgi:hypothetical protein